MLDMEELVEQAGYLREELTGPGKIPEALADEIVPFQYIMDDGLQQFYVFRPNPKGEGTVVHDLDEVWSNLTRKDHLYAATFTLHMKKFIENMIDEARSYEARQS